jgi:hypothetical protein
MPVTVVALFVLIALFCTIAHLCGYRPMQSLGVAVLLLCVVELLKFYPAGGH